MTAASLMFAVYFNPRSPHGERLRLLEAQTVTLVISTHAPRTGSDHVDVNHDFPSFYFNPRSPHGERLDFDFCRTRTEKFQPTLPARGATFWGQATSLPR